MWEHNIGIIGVQVFIGVGARVACEMCFPVCMSGMS